MALTVLKVKNAKPGRHVDGRGLCLVVKPSGARTWVLRMQLKGHRRDYGLGSAHDVSLTDARTAAAELRRRVRDGFDPVAERRKARKVIPTFEAATRTCHETSSGTQPFTCAKSSTTPMRWSKRRAVSGISSHIGDSASTTQALSTLSTGFLPMRGKR